MDFHLSQTRYKKHLGFAAKGFISAVLGFMSKSLKNLYLMCLLLNQRYVAEQSGEDLLLQGFHGKNTNPYRCSNPPYFLLPNNSQFTISGKNPPAPSCENPRHLPSQFSFQISKHFINIYEISVGCIFYMLIKSR